MAEPKRHPAHLGAIPVHGGGQLYVSVTPEGLIALGLDGGKEIHLQEGPALVLGAMCQLAVQVGQAARLRAAQVAGGFGIPRA